MVEKQQLGRAGGAGWGRLLIDNDPLISSLFEVITTNLNNNNKKKEP